MPSFRPLACRSRHLTSWSRVALVALFALSAACGKDDPSSPTVAGTVTLVSGDAQSVTVGLPGAQPMVVHVTAQNGSSLSGAPVKWAITAGGGTLADTVSTTGADGNASMTFTAGTLATTMSISATTGVLLPLVLTQKVTATVAASMAKFGGDGAAGLVNAGVQVVVKIADKYGNAVSGVTVNWTAGPEGGTLNASSSVSDVAGLARITLTLGASPKVYTVRAASGSFAEVVFSVTGV